MFAIRYCCFRFESEDTPTRAQSIFHPHKHTIPFTSSHQPCSVLSIHSQSTPIQQRDSENAYRTRRWCVITCLELATYWGPNGDTKTSLPAAVAICFSLLLSSITRSNACSPPVASKRPRKMPTPIRFASSSAHWPAAVMHPYHNDHQDSSQAIDE